MQASDQEREYLVTFRVAADALECTRHDIKALVLAGRLTCFNFGHDPDRISMTASRIPAAQIQPMVLARLSALLVPLIATAEVREQQREREEARARSEAWKAEWEQRHTGEAYYNPAGQWYVYTLATPADRIFYVGKGCGPRVHQHEQEAKKGHKCHKCHTIRKVWKNGGEIKKAIVFRSHDEQAAYDYESTLIARIGLPRLTNVQPGGGKVVRSAPRREDYYLTEKEHRYYLTLRGMKKDKIDEVIRGRIKDRIEILEDRVYTLRRYGYGNPVREAHACEIEQEILGMQATLGLYDQLSFLDTEQ